MLKRFLTRLLLPSALPRVEVVLPYCAVCGDPAMPSFTTEAFGPIAPPNATPAAGDWLRTPSGHALGLVFFALAAAAAPPGGRWVALSFGAENPPLGPAFPGSAALVGGLALGAGGLPAALLAANLGAAEAPLDVRGAGFACAPPAQQLCAVVYHAAPGDVARQGLRVEELLRAAGPVGAAGAVLLPPYALGALFCSAAPSCDEVLPNNT